MKDFINKNLGNYHVDALLDSGGMGEVYQGSNVNVPEIKVALKVMNPAWITQPEGRARFLQEAQSLHNLDHPNIVRLRDCGEDPTTGLLYLVMDLISGGSLRRLLDDYAGRGLTVPLDLALTLALQATAGLAYAHSQGIVHRDIKPENLLLQPVSDADSAIPYLLKIADFGLARLRQGMAGTSFQSSDGGLWVTLTYAAPEQLQGQVVDERSDIYALGVVLYELCSGQPPFPIGMGDVTAAREYHCTMPPAPPRTHRPDLPVEVELIILHCLAKDPAQRFATADEVGAALQRIISPGTPPPRHQPQQRETEKISLSETPADTPASSPPAPAPAPPILCIRDRTGQQRAVQLPGAVSIVGRDAGCDIVLTSPRVSRQHLRLEWDGTQVFVTDLDSSNRTRLDGQHVPPEQRTLWPPEATLQAGHDTLKWQQPGDTPRSSTVAIEPCAAAVQTLNALSAPVVESDQEIAQMVSEHQEVVALAIDIDQEMLQIGPGQSVPFSLVVTNQGMQTSAITIAVTGCPDDWLRFPATEMTLAPGQEIWRPIALTLPPTIAEHTGDITLTFRAVSQASGKGIGMVQTHWSIVPLTNPTSVTLTVTPEEYADTRIGRFMLDLQHCGTVPVTYLLQASSADQALEFIFPVNEVTLMPGSSQSIDLIVTAQQTPGKTVARHEFTVTAQPREAGAVLTVQGCFVQQAASRWSWWHLFQRID